MTSLFIERNEIENTNVLSLKSKQWILNNEFNSESEYAQLLYNRLPKPLKHEIAAFCVSTQRELNFQFKDMIRQGAIELVATLGDQVSRRMFNNVPKYWLADMVQANPKIFFLVKDRIPDPGIASLVCDDERYAHYFKLKSLSDTAKSAIINRHPQLADKVDVSTLPVARLQQHLNANNELAQHCSDKTLQLANQTNHSKPQPYSPNRPSFGGF